jgi:hypothetical protein
LTRAPDHFVDAIEALVKESNLRNYDDLQGQFKQAIDCLVRKGKVQFGPDHQLGGDSLTVRVRLILEDMGLTMGDEREKLEDLVVKVPAFATRSVPLVLEVKSGKAPNPTRGQLRQLDDWVFELSGEAQIRKNVYEKVDPYRTYTSPGAIPPRPSHPTPHKGVFLYNGPLGQPFDQRRIPMLSQNEAQFAQIRSFCVISFPCLLSWSVACDESSQAVQEFWGRVQTCTGELEHHSSNQARSAV